ncbi:hypothetical protein [Pectobacterium versatile]|uniref:hypothetical protein n=1 Tax=Pectobacterium versatile TaxID=2488639 RepID=UPI001FFD689B|nr:hypothetical protein [Pectobacterium versatile]MCO4311537.1 hypothetical protein [Pectobacterium versatile]
MGKINDGIGIGLTPVAHVDKRSAAAGSICWTVAGRALNLEHGTPLFLEPKPPAGLISFVAFLEDALPDKAYEYSDEKIRNAWIWLTTIARRHQEWCTFRTWLIILISNARREKHYFNHCNHVTSPHLPRQKPPDYGMLAFFYSIIWHPNSIP